MHLARRNNRILALLIGGLLVVTAACGGSESANDAERDRNITGGPSSGVPISAAPYQAIVYRMNDDLTIAYSPQTSWQDPRYWVSPCSAVIVNSWWVATNFSCTDTAGAPWRDDRFHIGVGKATVGEPVTTENIGNYVYGVSGSVSAGFGRNFVLLRLDREIKFEPGVVEAIDMPFDLDASWPEKGTTATISGYGYSNGAKTMGGGVLKSADVEILTNRDDNECGKWTNYWGADRLCLGRAKGAKGGLACPYDSGGPVVATVGDRKVLAGIIAEVSTGDDCATNGASLALPVRAMVRWMSGGRIDNLTATPSNGAVTLSWDEPYAVSFIEPKTPKWNPGVFDYVIQVSDDAGDTWQTIVDGVGTNTSYTVADLENDESYAFRVAAINEVTAPRADFRYYSQVVTATVGEQAPVPAPPDPWTYPDTPYSDIPMLPGSEMSDPYSTGLGHSGSQISSSTETTATTSKSAPGTTAKPATSPSPTAGQEAISGTPAPSGAGGLKVYVPSAAGGTGAYVPLDAGVIGVAGPTGPAVGRTLPTALKVGTKITPEDAARLAKVTVPTGSLVTVYIGPTSRRRCRPKFGGTMIEGLRPGACKVTFKVVTDGGKTVDLRGQLSVEP